MNIPQFQQPTPPQPARSEYSERQFLHTFLAGALLPLVQAAITAVIVFICTLIFTFDSVDPLTWPLRLSALTLVIVWFYLGRRWITLTNIERLLNVDLNHDNVIGEAPKESVRVQLDTLDNQGHLHISSTFDLPGTPQQLSTLAAGLLNNIPFSEREWSVSRRVFTGPEFRKLSSEMLKRGLIAPKSSKSNKQGFALTAAGRSVMKKLQSPSPTPDIEGE